MDVILHERSRHMPEAKGVFVSKSGEANRLYLKGEKISSYVNRYEIFCLSSDLTYGIAMSSRDFFHNLDMVAGYWREKGYDIKYLYEADMVEIKI